MLELLLSIVDQLIHWWWHAILDPWHAIEGIVQAVHSYFK